MSRCSYFIVVILVLLLFGCASFRDYGDTFKDEVLPVLMEKGANHARIRLAKLVAEGKLTNDQAAKILKIIDQLTAKDIAP